MEHLTLKPMLCELSELSRPDGSATICLGETVVMAAVYGPIEVRVQRELATEANIDVIYKPRIGLPGCRERLREHLLKNTVKSAIMSTQYPRTRICIVLQELHDSGSLLSSSVNAACLALMDSSVAMRCTIASVACVIDADSSDIVLDPNSSEENKARATFFFAFDSRNKSLVSSHSDGMFTEREFQECLSRCREASQKIFDFYREVVARRMSKVSSSEKS